jgi:hypothetical protein
VIALGPPAAVELKGQGRPEVIIMKRETQWRSPPSGEAKTVTAETSGGRIFRDVLLLAVAAMGGAISCSGPSESESELSDVEQVGRVEQPYTAQWYGVDGVSQFQRGEYLDYAQEALGGFSQQMMTKDNASFVYIGSLAHPTPGRVTYWRDADRYSGGLDHYPYFPQKGLDTAVLLFNATHGGVDRYSTPTTAGLNMYDWPGDPSMDTVLTNQMRLGDDARRTAFFASMTCQILYFQDGKLWERWWNVVAGGLKMALGNYCDSYAGREMGPIGPRFATYLQIQGVPMQQAWYYAQTSIPGNEHASLAAIATGANPDYSDCYTRLYGMGWTNHTGDSTYRYLNPPVAGCFWYNDNQGANCGVH